MAKRTALRLVSTTGLSKEEWLRVRQQGIGSSDCAAAIGVSPYKSQLALWMEKTGRVEAEDLAGNDAVYFGTLLEPLIAGEYSKRSGNKVKKVNAVLQHPEHPFILANLDREIVGGNEPGILEVKTGGFFMTEFWKDEVPYFYQAQVQHQLAVTGRSFADVAVLLGGQDYRCYRIERDEETIQRIIELEKEFWGWVESDVQPKADGSDSSADALARLFPQDFGNVIDFSSDTELNSVFSRLVDAREAKSQAEVIEEKLRQKIQERMATATKAIFSGGSVSWKTTKPRLVLDTDRLKTENEELVKQYQVERPGYRRFTVQVQ
jgi:putative phage-type endonuclease